MSKEIRRCVASAAFSTREEAGARYIEGYFAVFDSQTELWPGCCEVIKPGAFAKSLIENDIRALFNHNHDLILGRTAADTLTLKEDTKGLWGSILINEEDAMARDAYARVRRGDVAGCSFGCYITDERPIIKGPTVVWELHEVDLREVSPCVFPQYEDTEIEARKQNNRACLDRRDKELIAKRLEDIKNAVKTNKD